MKAAASPTTKRGAGEQQQRAWRVRRAEYPDVAAVAAAVAALLMELGAKPPSHAAIQDTAEAILDHPDSGVMLVAEINEQVIGLLSASWQIALHVPGHYGLIQDLWVEQTWRGQAVGASLVRGLEACARSVGTSRLEVGLPKETFAGLEATAAFYEARGFEPLGPRMRRVLR